MKHLARILMLLTLAVTLSQGAAAQQVFCNIVSSANGERTGYYEIEFANGAISATPLFTGDRIMANGGGVVHDNTFYFVRYHEFLGQIIPYCSALNLTTGTLTEDGERIGVNDRSLFATDVAWDPTSSKVYGVLYNSDRTGYSLATVDYPSATRQVIGDLKERLVAIACRADGQLFGIDNGGNLYRVGKTDASLALIGATGVVPATKQGSAAFDLTNGDLYWMACANDGVCHLYSVDTATGKATALGHLNGSEDIAGLYVTHDSSRDGTPWRPSALTASFLNGDHSGSIGFRMPEVDYNHRPLTGPTDYTLYADSVFVTTGSAQPGEAVTLSDVQAGSDGRKTFSVVCANSKGDGLSRDTALWVGYDIPAAPSGVTLTVDGAQRATLSWTAPAAGLNGGYVDTTALSYNITDAAGNTLTTGITGSTYSMQLNITAREAVQYGIVAVNHGHESAPALSNTVYVGDSTTLPYTQNFDSNDALQSMLVVDANGDGSTWNQNTAQQNAYIMTSRGADDWLATPAFQLKGGHTYHFAFTARNNNARRSEVVAAAYGTGDDPTAWTQILADTTLTTAQFVTLGNDITIGVDGSYRFAIHAKTPRSGNRIVVDDISVTEVQTTADAPAVVSALTATPGQQGLLTATLGFTLPTLTTGGKAIGSITAVNISRNGQELVQLTGDTLRAGATITWTDTHAPQGPSAYGVSVTAGGTTGETATATCYVGTDLPTAPLNVSAAYSNGRMHLSWTAPHGAGQHGGYVDAAALHYKIYKVSTSNVVADDISATSYDFAEDLSGEQDLLYYAVAAKSSAGEGGYCVSNIMVKGDAYALPFTESFPDGVSGHFWWTAATGTKNFQPETAVSHDGDNGCVYFYAAKAGDEAMLRSGKIDITEAANPTLIFWYYGYPGRDATLYVETLDDNWNATALDSVNYHSLTGREGWRKMTIALPKSGAPLMLQFRAKANDTTTAVAFDDITIRDQRSHDLSIAMTAPTAATPGQRRTAAVSVSNIGAWTATRFSVALKVNGTTVADSAIAGTLQPDSGLLLPMAFSVPMTTDSTFALSATVTWNADVYTDNNSTSAQVGVIASQLPAAALRGEKRDNSFALTWTDPSAESVTTTEGFETFDAWTHRLAPWTTIDGDAQPTLSVRGMTWPGAETPAAFFVFNADQCGQDTEADAYRAFRPHGGRQYLAALGAQNGSDDDWLISPTLSGRAQTVSFFARSISDSYRENFQILYATTDTTDIVQFTAYTTVANAENMWTRYTANLPEGTKRFAIHLTTPSANTFALLVDDVTCEEPSPAITGYDLYRDGRLLASLDAATHEFTDGGAAEADHSYSLVVRYDGGLSPFSNTVSTATGIARVEAGDTPQAAYSIDGRRLSGDSRRLPAGSHGVVVVKGKKFVK